MDWQPRINVVSWFFESPSLLDHTAETRGILSSPLSPCRGRRRRRINDSIFTKLRIFSTSVMDDLWSSAGEERRSQLHFFLLSVFLSLLSQRVLSLEMAYESYFVTFLRKTSADLWTDHRKCSICASHGWNGCGCGGFGHVFWPIGSFIHNGTWKPTCHLPSQDFDVSISRVFPPATWRIRKSASRYWFWLSTFTHAHSS